MKPVHLLLLVLCVSAPLFTTFAANKPNILVIATCGFLIAILMKRIAFNSTGFAKTLSLIGLISAATLLSAHAAPPPSAFGVWDRGSSFDPKDHPFLKGMAFNDKWASVEKPPGVYDWSTLDQAMDSAVQRNQFVYLSINVGPDAPEWIYMKGVPRVECKVRFMIAGRCIPSILRRNTKRCSND